jgi:hypothetical protein
MKTSFKTECQPDTQEEANIWIAELKRQGPANVRASLASRWDSGPGALLPIGGFWMLRGFVQDWLAANEKRERRNRELTFWLVALIALLAVLSFGPEAWRWISIWFPGQ